MLANSRSYSDPEQEWLLCQSAARPWFLPSVTVPRLRGSWTDLGVRDVEDVETDMHLKDWNEIVLTSPT